MMTRFQPAARSIWAGFAALPALMRAGATVFLLSATVDLYYHLSSAAWQSVLDQALGEDAYYVHLALFAGMLLILSGVFRFGLRHGSTVAGQRQKGGKQTFYG